VPALEAALAQFQAAHTQVLGVSVDSIHSHANWARSLGGVSFPLLSDFEPKGAVARSYGMYLQEAGISDRATVLIDSDGVVQHASSVTPAGKRDIGELVALCEEHNASSDCVTVPFGEPLNVPANTTLFVKSDCGFSRAAATAVENLHLSVTVPVRNVSEDSQARRDFEAVSDRSQAPCLLIEGTPMFESAEIVERLANLVSKI
jgi:glutaredoxin